MIKKQENIKKRWQEYTEEPYKKDRHDPDNHDGVISHLEPDLLECEVKWALESITTNKASGGDGIPVELFQILKDDAVKVLHSDQIRSVAQSCPALCDPMDCSLPGSSVHGDSPGKNTGRHCHFLFWGIFPTQGSYLYLLYWQADSLPLSH